MIARKPEGVEHTRHRQNVTLRLLPLVLVSNYDNEDDCRIRKWQKNPHKEFGSRFLTTELAPHRRGES